MGKQVLEPKNVQGMSFKNSEILLDVMRKYVFLISLKVPFVLILGFLSVVRKKQEKKTILSIC